MNLSKADIAQLKRTGARIASKKPVVPAEAHYLKELSQKLEQLDALIAKAEQGTPPAPAVIVPNKEPCSWRFKMERDDEGRLTDIIAEPI